MSTLKADSVNKKYKRNILFGQYEWFNQNFYNATKSAFNEFFKQEFNVRLLGISQDENILFYGDEYFVNKLPISKYGNFKVKISSSLIDNMLDIGIGKSNTKFELKSLTNIEAMLIKSFTVFLYNKIEPFMNKSDISKILMQNSKDYSFTFYLRFGKKHIGKIIISIPDFLICEVPNLELKTMFSIEDFASTQTNIPIVVGKSKITLTEIKAIEDGDIILLENSNINFMSVIANGEEVQFRLEPNPSLIVSINNNGDNEMEEETSAKSQNMWDSILVDVVAEFDNVKLTLGELKQISEGLVIDVGSVYDNKVKLRVENQVVATGELVILNDRYGVKINSVKKSKDASKTKAKPAQKQETAPAPASTAQTPQTKEQPAQGDENFDYSDFEIEDESI